jgi:hypothetical protein
VGGEPLDVENARAHLPMREVMSKHSAGADRAERPIRGIPSQIWVGAFHPVLGQMRDASCLDLGRGHLHARPRTRHPHAIRIKSTRLLGLAALVDRGRGTRSARGRGEESRQAGSLCGGESYNPASARNGREPLRQAKDSCLRPKRRGRPSDPATTTATPGGAGWSSD